MENDKVRLEREQIESRIHLLVKCLEETELVKQTTDSVRKKHKERLNELFESIRMQLNLLETQVGSKLDKCLFQKQIDMPIRTLEFEIRQLIVSLSSSMSLLTSQQKLTVLSNVDISIKQYISKMNDIDRYNKNQLANSDNFNKLTQSLNLVLENIKETLEQERPNLIKNYDHNNNEQSKTDDIKQWLLVSNTNTSNPQENMFDFVDFESELDSIEVLTDFEELNSNYRLWLLDPSQDETSKRKKSMEMNKRQVDGDGFSNTFDEINRKPLDYWLLR